MSVDPQEIKNQLDTWARLSNINEEQWENIKERAHDYIEGDLYGGDPIRCVIASFVAEINNELLLQVDEMTGPY